MTLLCFKNTSFVPKVFKLFTTRNLWKHFYVWQKNIFIFWRNNDSKLVLIIWSIFNLQCHHSFCWLILKTSSRKIQTTTDINVKLLHLRYTFLNLKWNLYKTLNWSSHFIFLLVKSLNVRIIFFLRFSEFSASFWK